MIVTKIELLSPLETQLHTFPKWSKEKIGIIFHWNFVIVNSIGYKTNGSDLYEPEMTVRLKL